MNETNEVEKAAAWGRIIGWIECDGGYYFYTRSNTEYVKVCFYQSNRKALQLLEEEIERLVGINGKIYQTEDPWGKPRYTLSYHRIRDVYLVAHVERRFFP